MNNSRRLSKFSMLSKWVVITGAAGLLGKQHTIALLEMDANVILLDKNSYKLEKLQNELIDLKFKGKIICYQLDVTNEEKIKELKNELLVKGISVNVLINNAAINPKHQVISNGNNNSRVENFDLADWDIQLDVGLKGTFICSKIFGSEMAKNKNGVIINIASDLSIIAPDQRIYKTNELNEHQDVKPITYSVIKSGLIGMTKYLATYWNESNVRVNALSPGGVFENQDSNFVEKLNSLIPLGRMASPEEYKSAIQFLSSDASSYMTGHNLIIDGGRSVW